MQFLWTYYKTSSNQALSPELEIISPEFFSGFLSGNSFVGAKQKWQLALNSFDVDIGHTLKLADSISLRPTLGIKGAKIKQSIDSDWKSIFYISNEQINHNFSGFGPSFSLSGKWEFFQNVNLLSHFSTAFLWGKWDVTDRYSRPSALFGLITPTTITTSMLNNTLGTAMLDFSIGIGWEHQGRMPFELQINYEMQYWPNQLRLASFQQLPLHGDLTLQGGTCVIYLDL
jgi:hypothetical protein